MVLTGAAWAPLRCNNWVTFSWAVLCLAGKGLHFAAESQGFLQLGLLAHCWGKLSGARTKRDIPLDCSCLKEGHLWLACGPHWYLADPGGPHYFKLKKKIEIHPPFFFQTMFLFDLSQGEALPSSLCAH